MTHFNYFGVSGPLGRPQFHKAFLGARACVQVRQIQEKAALCVCVVKPTKESKDISWCSWDITCRDFLCVGICTFPGGKPPNTRSQQKTLTHTHQRVIKQTLKANTDQMEEKGRPFYLWSGLFCLQLVFVAYEKFAWSFLLTVEIQFGLVCLQWKIGVVFLTYGVPLSRNCI